MPDSVLYFPSLRVPGTEWFTRVLLYWDHLLTTIPPISRTGVSSQNGKPSGFKSKDRSWSCSCAAALANRELAG